MQIFKIFVSPNIKFYNDCQYTEVVRFHKGFHITPPTEKATRERLSENQNLKHKTIPSPRTLLSNRSSFISNEQNVFQATSRTSNRLPTYVLPVDFVGPSRVLLDQITSCGLHLPKYQRNPIVGRLSSKVFLGGVPVIAQQVTTVTRDQLQWGLEMFGTVTLLWPKGITVKPSSGFHYPNRSALEVKRGGILSSLVGSGHISFMTISVFSEKNDAGRLLILQRWSFGLSLYSPLKARSSNPRFTTGHWW